MKNIRKNCFAALMALSFLTFSCGGNRDSDCFDRELYNQHKDDICTEDCPIVTGCDGKTYCNECIANAQGIRVE